MFKSEFCWIQDSLLTFIFNSSALYTYHPVLFWTPWHLGRWEHLTSLRISFTWVPFLTLLFRFFLVFDSLTVTCAAVELSKFILPWTLLSLLNVQINVFHQIWDVFSHDFFKQSFCSFIFLLWFWDSQHACWYISVSQRSPRLWSFFFSFLSVLHFG